MLNNKNEKNNWNILLHVFFHLFNEKHFEIIGEFCRSHTAQTSSTSTNYDSSRPVTHFCIIDTVMT